MAPTLITTIGLPARPPFFNIPTTTPAALPLTPKSTSSTALYVVLIIAIVLLLVATAAIVWLCFWRRNRRPSARNLPEVSAEDAIRGKAARDSRQTYVIPKTWDSTQPFWAVPSISTTETRMNEKLLAEVPNVWRILGRPNVAVDSDEEAIPAAHRKSF
ncbi:hypothetical protein FB45DRAFT_1056932 [Roridomyces roridus]|uniref:Uncharacterized protein n=1 Tax=Roridomyces roridus TaxID=1738132 RepID=A0AAD7BZJ8_9AGAR|nr:hypothetical protein FB45DRAFT_1056932 [Roridomyces roridus]